MIHLKAKLALQRLCFFLYCWTEVKDGHQYMERFHWTCWAHITHLAIYRYSSWAHITHLAIYRLSCWSHITHLVIYYQFITQWSFKYCLGLITFVVYKNFVTLQRLCFFLYCWTEVKDGHQYMERFHWTWHNMLKAQILIYYKRY
jgi:hypothetical protein